MRPVSAFAHLMSSTVLIASRLGQDSAGRPLFDVDVSYRAHIGRTQQLVRTATGQEVASQKTVWLATADPILPTARITLSTGDVGSTEPSVIRPPIVAVERLSDGRGPHHTVLFL